MRQPHKNIFYFYRGPSKKGNGHEFAFEKQLEDNTTKALIHVLERSDRSIYLTAFLRNIAKLQGRHDGVRAQFALQRVDIKQPAILKRIALAIAPLKGLSRGEIHNHQSGRPDAWIWSDDEYAILIENKINGRANLAQIKRHIASADGWKLKNTRRVDSTWQDVYMLFDKLKRLHSRDADSVSKFLVTEFLEYLKMTGIAHTATFEIDDFVFFTMDPSDRQSTQKEIVARKLKQFTEELAQKSVVRKIMKLYGKKHKKAESYVSPGAFRKTSSNFWITLGPKERREHCHLTVRISQEGIRLDAFAPHRNHTKKLLRAIKADPDGFLAAIKQIPHDEPYVFRLREAYYKNPDSPYKGQRIGLANDYLEVHPSLITKHNVDAFLIDPVKQRLRRKDLRPEVFLTRDFKMNSLLSRTDTVGRVAEAVENMVPYIKFVLRAS